MKGLYPVLILPTVSILDFKIVGLNYFKRFMLYVLNLEYEPIFILKSSSSSINLLAHSPIYPRKI